LGRAPLREARLLIEIDPLDQWDLIDRCEQAGAPKIRSNDLRDSLRRFPIGGAAGKEIRQCDPHRLQVTLVEIDEGHCCGRVNAKRRNGANPGCSAEQYGTAARQWL
jgi:hypothetical protein